MSGFVYKDDLADYKPTKVKISGQVIPAFVITENRWNTAATLAFMRFQFHKKHDLARGGSDRRDHWLTSFVDHPKKGGGKDDKKSRIEYHTIVGMLAELLCRDILTAHSIPHVHAPMVNENFFRDVADGGQPKWDIGIPKDPKADVDSREWWCDAEGGWGSGLALGLQVKGSAWGWPGRCTTGNLFYIRWAAYCRHPLQVMLWSKMLPHTDDGDNLPRNRMSMFFALGPRGLDETRAIGFHTAGTFFAPHEDCNILPTPFGRWAHLSQTVTPTVVENKCHIKRLGKVPAPVTDDVLKLLAAGRLTTLDAVCDRHEEWRRRRHR